MKKYDVFISYRRATGSETARTLQQTLTSRGLSVFLDSDSLNDGKFNTKIYSAIKSVGVFLLVLTGGALDRCVNKDDWVRRELEHAIASGKNIIPVSLVGNGVSFPEKLPQSLSGLRDIHISEIDMGQLFNESVDKVIADRFPASMKKKARAGVSIASRPDSSPRLNWGLIGGLLALLALDVAHIVFAARRKNKE